MSVVLNTHDASLRTELLRLFEGAAPTGSQHISQRAVLKGDLRIASTYVAPGGTRVFKDRNEVISLHVPRRKSPDDTALLPVFVRPNNEVIIKDNKK